MLMQEKRIGKIACNGKNDQFCTNNKLIQEKKFIFNNFNQFYKYL